ncbi:MAG: hypothetical protein J7K00_04690 [Candidatus Diapherotrites archaeon]|nr:hypothetical protein [Candidatus Diapherotrites archaeon]
MVNQPEVNLPEKEQLKELVKKYGSPLFVVSEAKIISQYSKLKREFCALYPNTKIAYAYKANYLPAICDLINREGGLAEVICGFEYQIAKIVGVKGSDTVINGPYKPTEELEDAIECNCMINVDNFDELKRINEIGLKKNKQVNIGIRINTKIWHLLWNQFGFNIESGEAFKVAETIQDDFSNLNLTGIHIHIGTSLTDAGLYEKSVLAVISFIKKLEGELKIEIEYIDLGGGFSSKGTCPADKSLEEWSVPKTEDYAKKICGPLNKFPGDKKPLLILEPGQYMVDEAVVLISSVVAVKNIFGIRSLFLDAGINILPSALYRKHLVKPLTASQSSEEQEKEITDIYGPLCMSIDLLETGVMLPKLQAGDLLVIHNAGAYEMSRSTQFTRPRPAVVSVDKNGKIRLVKKRETIKEILALDNLKPNDPGKNTFCDEQ